MSKSKIDMLTRVEGHGSVELIRKDGQVVDARLKLFESPRLFEQLFIGRRFDEVADIACRICSICSTVHKVSALQAVEQALGVAVSRQTALLRELAVQGGQIESHALHVFCLALPDYLGMRGFQELATSVPEKLKVGLRIKKLGNLIQETVGGRAIHPFNLLVGGLGRVPETDQLKFLNDQLSEIHDDVTESIEYFFGFNDILPPLTMAPGCAVNGGPPLFGDHLVTSTGMNIPANSAAAWLNERVESYTNAKVSNFDENGVYIVGPMARLKQSMPPGFAQHFAGTSIGSPLKARIIEIQSAVERALVLIDHLLYGGMKTEPPVPVNPAQGEGTSLLEAPRGVLLHSYKFDSSGICSGADIVTPTAINQGAIAASLKELINAMDGAAYDQIKSAAEVLIRYYDPCISCAVH